MSGAFCKGCRHLRVKPDRDGKVRLRRDNVYRCGAPLPAMPEALPAWAHARWEKIGRVMDNDRRVLPFEVVSCGAREAS